MSIMTYEEAFSKAVAENAATRERIKIYRATWDGSYFPSRYLVPLPHAWAVLIGEVGRRTPR
jgi:hypothetical protein